VPGVAVRLRRPRKLVSAGSGYGACQFVASCNIAGLFGNIRYREINHRFPLAIGAWQEGGAGLSAAAVRSI
jgi:hypothetical protein